MKIKFKNKGDWKEEEVAKGTSIAQLLEAKRLNRETFLLKLNGRIAHEETLLANGDELECWNVIYGG